MKNKYRKFKLIVMGQALLITVLTCIVGYGVLVFFVDGVLQDTITHLMVQFFMKFNLSYWEAVDLYNSVFIDHKIWFLGFGFLTLFLIFFYVAISRMTDALDQVGRGIDNVLNDADVPVRLPMGLDPLAERLNEMKIILRRREYEAMESEQRKNDLVVFLAHDLKTPLTSVIAYLTMLDGHPEMDAEPRQKYIHTSLDKAIRLGDLINEFFEITRFNLQDIVLEKERLNLSMMLEQMADESYGMLKTKSMTCSVDADENLMVEADPDKLARVFDNLLRNAVAYSDPGTNIAIQARGSKNTIIITFTNFGPTIPRQKLMSIFEKFYRADPARSGETGGSGLGLAIAREIVELHGGKIEAASSEGRTTFMVSLPRGKMAPPKKAAKKEMRDREKLPEELYLDDELPEQEAEKPMFKKELDDNEEE